MKKALCIVLTLLIGSLFFFVSSSAVRAATSGDFEYTVNPDGISATITGYTGNGGEVTIPATVDGYPVIVLGSCVFDYNDNVTHVTISEGVETIQTEAFSQSNTILTVSIPSTMSKIAADAFYNCCSVREINVSHENLYYASECGVLFNKDYTHLIKYPVGKTNSTYSVPGSVSHIELRAFQSSELSTVSIPESVVDIGEQAFGYCKLITSISLPKSVENIGAGAFGFCERLKTIDVANENPFFSSIDGVLFDKHRTKLIQYPAGKENREYSIPLGVTEIGEKAFYGCWLYLQEVMIPDGVTYIRAEAFSSCNSLTSIVLPDSVTEIGEEAFGMCISLAGISIPNSITTIKDNTFLACTGLKSVGIPKNVTSIGRRAFSSCRSLTSVMVPESVDNIDYRAFHQCENLANVYFYGDAPSMGSEVFIECDPHFTIYYSNDKTGYSDPWYGYKTVARNPDAMPPYPSGGYSGTYNNYTYWISDGTATITHYNGENSVVSIPANLSGCPVTTIGVRAFHFNQDIVDVRLPESITTIEDEAFLNCGSLESIYIPESAVNIGFQVFGGCDRLRKVNLPSRLKRISDAMFYACSSLSSITIPEGVTIIGSCAFYYCGFESITIPSTVTMIGNSVFAQNYNLSSVYFNGNAPQMGDPMGGSVGHIDYGRYGIFDFCDEDFTIYYPTNAIGYTNPWHGYPTQPYDPAAQINSTIYSINRQRGYLSGVGVGTSVSSLKGSLSNDAGNIKVYDASVKEYKGNLLCTGMKVKLIIEGTVRDELTIVILGDGNGDGKISITDYTLTRLDILDLKALDGEFREASDINGDGIISITDYTLIRLDILGLKSIH